MKKELRYKVYLKHDGRCAYCGNAISYPEMQVDHINPKRCGGSNDFENLNPSCRRCNHYKRAETLENFRQQLMTLHERTQKIYINKVAEDYGIIKIEPFNGKFYYEKQSKR